MKITMYELLGMIKDGKSPKKIKYRQNIFEFIHGLGDYKPDDIAKYHGNYLLHYLFEEEVNFLNDEVEILEEEKKIPEKLPSICACSDFNENEEKLAKNINILKNKYNEIIDYLDYLKSKGDE